MSHDKRPSINVWPGSWTRLADSTLMLRASGRVRVRVVPDQADADYIVTNYREDQRDYASENPEFRLFHQVTVDGHVVNATYLRLKPRFPRPRSARSLLREADEGCARRFATLVWTGHSSKADRRKAMDARP